MRYPQPFTTRVLCIRLDALMGPRRDVAQNPAEDWKDDTVCRSYSILKHLIFIWNIIT